MSKTPISILQEQMDISRKQKPLYEETPSDLSEYRFKCVVQVDGITAAGYGSTKQAAKQNSAAEALKKMGLISKSDSNNNINFSSQLQNTSHRAFVNYVGELNELASVNGRPYASYVEQHLLNIGSFVMHCTFLEWTSKGCGTTKKSAKQVAAKNMLELLKTKNISIMETKHDTLDTNQKENINKLTEEVTRRIDMLPTISRSNERSTDVKFPILKNQVDSLAALKNLLSNRGYEFSITMIQQHPVVLMLKLDNSQCVIMGNGTSYELATQDLLQMASLMLSNGFSWLS